MLFRSDKKAETFGSLFSNICHYSPTSQYIYLPSEMSPSSVCDNGIKGVDIDALSHLGPNVGRPVYRPNYYQNVHRYDCTLSQL